MAIKYFLQENFEYCINQLEKQLAVMDDGISSLNMAIQEESSSMYPDEVVNMNLDSVKTRFISTRNQTEAIGESITATRKKISTIDNDASNILTILLSEWMVFGKQVEGMQGKNSSEIWVEQKGICKQMGITDVNVIVKNLEEEAASAKIIIDQEVAKLVQYYKEGKWVPKVVKRSSEYTLAEMSAIEQLGIRKEIWGENKNVSKEDLVYYEGKVWDYKEQILNELFAGIKPQNVKKYTPIIDYGIEKRNIKPYNHKRVNQGSQKQGVADFTQQDITELRVQVSEEFTRGGIIAENDRMRFIVNGLNIFPSKTTNVIGAIASVVEKESLTETGKLSNKEAIQALLSLGGSAALGQMDPIIGTGLTAGEIIINEATKKETVKCGRDFLDYDGRGNSNGIDHILIQEGDIYILYDVYQDGKLIGNDEVYIRDDEIIALWEYRLK